jgi:hypothetical protein
MSREERTMWICEDRVLREVFGPKSEKFTEELRKYLREELRGWNSLPNTIMVITSMIMRDKNCI